MQESYSFDEITPTQITQLNPDYMEVDGDAHKVYLYWDDTTPEDVAVDLADEYFNSEGDIGIYPLSWEEFLRDYWAQEREQIEEVWGKKFADKVFQALSELVGE